MTIVFNGKTAANQREIILKSKVDALKNDGVTPKLVSFLVGDDPGSILYTSLKKSVAERVGIEFEVAKFADSASFEELSETIKNLNSDPQVHGIMIQLPLPGALFNKTQKLIHLIAKEKDVDGLRSDSPFVPATVKAIETILYLKYSKEMTVVVVGSKGEVGRRLIHYLKMQGIKVLEVNKDTIGLASVTQKGDVLVSVTGEPLLIKKNMVKVGAIVIDVGSPKGDVDFEEVSKIASFITPVPGGVGPMTIVSLMENVILATQHKE